MCVFALKWMTVLRGCIVYKKVVVIVCADFFVIKSSNHNYKKKNNVNRHERPFDGKYTRDLGVITNATLKNSPLLPVCWSGTTKQKQKHWHLIRNIIVIQKTYCARCI